MRQSPFIWLGSGRTRKRNVARKGRLLDQAARSGLPVPSGGILLDDFYRICLAEGLAEIVDSAVIIPDPVWLHEVLYRDVRFPRLEKRVAVRSASAVPAGSTRLDVDFCDPVQVADALREMWSAINRLDVEQPHDVLVMEMVAAQIAGEALSAPDSARDQVRVTMGAGNDLPASFFLDKIGTFQRASTDLPPFAQRLQKLLRGVRRSFGKEERRIDWADDGEICRLLQVY